jgi:Rps23 Pro-64 3,4-dihydroxylase Tpa1-like proline 4-hydroxylase
MEINDTNLENYIKIYENFLPEKIYNNYTKYVYDLKQFDEGTVVKSDVPNKEIRNVLLFNCINSEDEKSFTNIHWTNFLTSMLKNKINDYFSNINKESIEIVTLQILKYNVGGHYKIHTDMCSEFPRTLSFIYLVNENYEGGDLIFFSPINKKQIKIERKKNTLIVWPSNFLYPHGVTPVTKGVRYSVVAWAV